MKSRDLNLQKKQRLLTKILTECKPYWYKYPVNTVEMYYELICEDRFKKKDPWTTKDTWMSYDINDYKYQYIIMDLCKIEAMVKATIRLSPNVVWHNSQGISIDTDKVKQFYVDLLGINTKNITKDQFEFICNIIIDNINRIIYGDEHSSSPVH